MADIVISCSVDFLVLRSRMYGDIVKPHRANLMRLPSLLPRGCMFHSCNFDSDCEVARFSPTYFEASRSFNLCEKITHEKDLVYGKIRTMV